MHWLLLPLFLLASFAHADSPSGMRILVPNVFSYQAPPGWIVLKTSPEVAAEVPYPVVVEKMTEDPSGIGKPQAMISVNVDNSPKILLAWCRDSLAQSRSQFADSGYQPRIGEPEPFTTAAGVQGLRAPLYLTARAKPIRYEIYFFAAPGGQKLAVTCACPAEDVDHYLPLFDAAMKTFVPY